MAQITVVADQPVAQVMTVQPAAGGFTFDLRFNLVKDGVLGFCYAHDLDTYAALPAPLAERGVTAEDWGLVFGEIKKFSRDMHPCYPRCPQGEGLYFCFPGSFPQFIACMFNPITWVLFCPGWNYRDKTAMPKIKQIMGKYNITCKCGAAYIKFSSGPTNWLTGRHTE